MSVRYLVQYYPWYWYSALFPAVPLNSISTHSPWYISIPYHMVAQNTLRTCVWKQIFLKWNIKSQVLLLIKTNTLTDQITCCSSHARYMFWAPHPIPRSEMLKIFHNFYLFQVTFFTIFLTFNKLVINKFTTY